MRSVTGWISNENWNNTPHSLLVCLCCAVLLVGYVRPQCCMPYLDHDVRYVASGNTAMFPSVPIEIF